MTKESRLRGVPIRVQKNEKHPKNLSTPGMGRRGSSTAGTGVEFVVIVVDAEYRRVMGFQNKLGICYSINY